MWPGECSGLSSRSGSVKAPSRRYYSGHDDGDAWETVAWGQGTECRADLLASSTMGSQISMRFPNAKDRAEMSHM